ncbi:MAG: NYN domain-containing protein [Actinomycetota bacterium]
MKLAFVYVDGHNLYHGAVRDVPELKWLDMTRLASQLLGRGYNVGEVNYYTAVVVDSAADPHQSQRQGHYLRALEATGVKVERGHFREQQKRVRLIDGSTAEAAILEEKRTDVSMATDLSWDAAQRRMDTALVISNDGDFVHAVRRAKQTVEVITVNPHRLRKRRRSKAPGERTNHPLGAHASLDGHDKRQLRVKHLWDSQLPDVVTATNGESFRRPTAWHAPNT